MRSVQLPPVVEHQTANVVMLSCLIPPASEQRLQMRSPTDARPRTPQGSMGVSMAAAAALEPREPLQQSAEAPIRKEPLTNSNAAETTVASPNSLLFLPNKNKARPAPCPCWPSRH